MKKISKISLLYVLDWVLFVIFFSSNLFDAVIFKSVSVAISKLQIPDIVSTTLLTLWMIIPQSLILAVVNALYLKIPAKKFTIVQILFAVSVVLLLFIVIATAKVRQ